MPLIKKLRARTSPLKRRRVILTYIVCADADPTATALAAGAESPRFLLGVDVETSLQETQAHR